ncbi:MAG TPA: bifunctional serine/threonine-protein kinase/formylglycine-generating enzyme family protein [Kofleriaceae bacterium]|jgi:serine/threonine protein kinase|nr:bifunctional serine/threonine-protein kinase/formylglycine-generating enzyme family protein [Kofleriaceae bacterium]
MVPSDSDALETLPARCESNADGEHEHGGDGDGDGEGELDSEADAVLRAVAFAPPRRVPNSVVPGMRWGDGDRYIIERRLGHGGMGTVYAATDSVLGRSVALKVLDATPGQDASHHATLLREAQLAARVEHERIARIYDVGMHEGLAFVAMEYCQGGTLRQWMIGRSVPLPEIIGVALQIAEGLAELHTKGVVHRDLKPENVGMTKQGGLKLLDFGLARYAVRPAEDIGLPGRSSFIEGVSIAAASGTPGYMAPEQYEGRPIDARVDVFAFGVILHELVTGQRLFPGATIGAISEATLAWRPVLRGDAWDDLPAGVRELVARMLAREPDARFADGSRVLAALTALEIDVPSQARISRLPSATVQTIGKAPTQRALPRHVPVRLRSRLPASGIGVACACAAVVLFIVMRPGHRALPPPAADMALINVGTLEVGRDFPEIVTECHQLGASCDPSWMIIEAPRAQVTVAPFYLDKTEVTNTQFAAMLNELRGVLAVQEDQDHHVPRFVHRNAATGSGDEVLYDLDKTYAGIEHIPEEGYRVKPGYESLPVSQVSWYGAAAFCEWRGKRLPSEDEWEAAARGREDRPFPWGDAAMRCGAVVIPNDGRLALSAACPEKVQMSPVGSAAQDVTPDGVHDLAGNVSEWTSTPYYLGPRGGYASHPKPDAPRTFRGGSWAQSYMAHPSGRSRLAPSLMGVNIGFRCAQDVAKTD